MFRKLILASSEKSLIEEFWEAIVEQYLTPKYGNYQNIKIDNDPLVSSAAIFIGIFFAIMIACVASIFTKRTLGRPVRLLLKHDAVGRENAKTLAEVGLEKPGVIRYFINRLTLAKAIRCVEEDEFYGLVGEEASKAENEENTVEKTEEKIEEKTEKEIGADEKSGVAPDEDLSADPVKDTEEEKSDAEEEELLVKEEIASRAKNAYYVSSSAKKKYKRNVESDRFYIEEKLKYRTAIRFSAKGSNPVTCVFIGVAYIVFGLLVIRFLPDILGFIDDAIGSFK